MAPNFIATYLNKITQNIKLMELNIVFYQSVWVFRRDLFLFLIYVINLCYINICYQLFVKDVLDIVLLVKLTEIKQI